jgi:hypothetical protein
MRINITKASVGTDTLYTVSQGPSLVRFLMDGRSAVVTEHCASTGHTDTYKCSAEAAAQSLHNFRELQFSRF